MDRLHGAADAIQRLNALDYPVSEAAFDSAFSNQD
jgi:hypothetical protein